MPFRPPGASWGSASGTLVPHGSPGSGALAPHRDPGSGALALPEALLPARSRLAGLGCPSSALTPHGSPAPGAFTPHRDPGSGALTPTRAPIAARPRPTRAPCRCRRTHARRAPSVPARSHPAGPLCRFRRVLPALPAGGDAPSLSPGRHRRDAPSPPGGVSATRVGGRSGIEKHRRGRPPRLSVARDAGGGATVRAGRILCRGRAATGRPDAPRRRPDRAGERRRGPRRRTRPTDGEPGPWSRAPTRISRADTSPTATT